MKPSEVAGILLAVWFAALTACTDLQSPVTDLQSPVEESAGAAPEITASEFHASSGGLEHDSPAEGVATGSGEALRGDPGNGRDDPGGNPPGDDPPPPGGAGPLLTRQNGRFLLDGEEIARFGIRAANVLQNDEIAQRFIAAMPVLKAYGMQSFAVSIQGGRASEGGNSAFNGYEADGSLKPEIASRLAIVLDAAAQQKLVPVVIFFYRGRDQELAGNAAVREAVRSTMEFLAPWRHLWINMINEPNHSGFDHPILTTAAGQVELHQLAKETDPARIVYVSHEPGANDGFYSDSWGRLPQVTPPAAGNVSLEYVQGDTYLAPGVFTERLMPRAQADAETSYQNAGYWFFYAAWHQKADAPGWPRFDRGGFGTAADPGVGFIWDTMKSLQFP